MISYKNKIIVVTAPSGSGKTTIVKNLLEKYSFLDFSVSATTREKREGEIDGKDYLFISHEDFRKKISNNAFVEWEEVYSNQFYGTLHSELERIWNSECSAVFDIDVVGAVNIKKMFGSDCLSIFIKAPDIDTLYSRLLNRQSESPESLQKRTGKAEKELELENEFDITIVNDQLPIAIRESSYLIENFLNVDFYIQ
jgi:guanylate kinase